MKSPLLLLAFTALLFTSCTTAYKTGQTPDDVYYSPARPQDEYKEAESKNERKYRYDDDYYDDRYLRMKVRNRNRWSDLDNWYYYDRYSIGYNYYFGTFNNPFNAWNYYYNPYCCCVNNFNYVFINPKTPAAPPVVKRHFNLAGYNNTATNNNNTGLLKTRNNTTARPVYNNTNSNNNSLSNKVRTIFSNDNSGSGSSRTYSPSSSGSSGGSSRGSSSGSGGSGGGVSRPGRN